MLNAARDNRFEQRKIAKARQLRKESNFMKEYEYNRIKFEELNAEEQQRYLSQESNIPSFMTA